MFSIAPFSRHWKRKKKKGETRKKTACNKQFVHIVFGARFGGHIFKFQLQLIAVWPLLFVVALLQQRIYPTQSTRSSSCFACDFLHFIVWSTVAFFSKGKCVFIECEAGASLSALTTTCPMAVWRARWLRALRIRYTDSSMVNAHLKRDGLNMRYVRHQ